VLLCCEHPLTYFFRAVALSGVPICCFCTVFMLLFLCVSGRFFVSTSMAPELIRSRHNAFNAGIRSLGIVRLDLADYEPSHTADVPCVSCSSSPRCRGRHSVPQPRGHPPFARSSPRASSPTLRGGRAWRSSRARADFAVRLSLAEEFVALLATLGMGVDGVFGGDAPTAAAAVAAAATSSPPASMAVQSYLWGVGGEGQCRSGFEMKLGGCAAALSRLGRLSHGSGSRGCRWCFHPCCPTPFVYSSCLLFPMQPPADAPFALKRRSAASFFFFFSDSPKALAARQNKRTLTGSCTSVLKT